jgi:hypothetical protein
MSWESYRGRLRYTRTFRRNGRVVRQYVGTGPVAEMVARVDALARATRERQRESRRAERAAWEAARTPLRELERVTDLLVNAALVAAGFHRHDRGQWRRRHTHDGNTAARVRAG